MAAAGWYRTPEGTFRYWDGRQWTDYVASGPPQAPTTAPPGPPAAQGERSPSRFRSWAGWGGLGLCALLGAASGASGLLILAGFYVLVVAAVGLLRGRVGWARLRGRAASGVAAAVGFALLTVGGAIAGPLEDTPAAAPPSSPSTTTSSTTTPTTRDTPSSETSSAATLTSTTTASSTPAAATSTPPPATTASKPAPTTTRATAAAQGAALAALAKLAVKGRAPKTGYDRDRFGPAWADVDRNGCDTRNDILRRDLSHYVLEAGTHGCLVLSGSLKGPYTGQAIHFVRGVSTSTKVQIDHVVALSDAWQKGAQRLSATSREKFANDPLNLLAVDGPTNAAKGDGDAATWLPPNKSYRCPYAARQVAVKTKYHLWITAAERDAIARVLRGCPRQSLPAFKAIPLGGGSTKAPAPSTTHTATRTKAPAPTKTASATDPQFRTCTDAKAHGYGPYYRGKDPEYDWYRDADSDGIVCE